MVIAVLGLLAVCLLLIVAKVVPVVAGIALMVVGLFAVVGIGERRDRSRQRGLGDPSRRLDPNRGAVPAMMDLGGEDQTRTYADAQVASAIADRGVAADRKDVADR